MGTRGRQIRFGVVIADSAVYSGVRTAGLLARQSPEKVHAIRVTIENQMQQYAAGNEFVLPVAAHVVTVAKR